MICAASYVLELLGEYWPQASEAMIRVAMDHLMIRRLAPNASYWTRSQHAWKTYSDPNGILTRIFGTARKACGMQHQQPHMRDALLLHYRLGLAESQQATGVAVWPRTGLRKPRDGPVNGTGEVFHKQDCLWSCFSNLASFPTRLSHQFLTLHSDNVLLADTVFFTIVTDYFIRSEAIVACSHSDDGGDMLVLLCR